ncbi:hypothetical protein M8J76_007222 [Diaphorina citri]|nr:hypothetical protein M8J75_012094 [Diaphorina citri]KAI5744991.1 hypothetical protein M8J76_007222 [Diaphorina citri]
MEYLHKYSTCIILLLYCGYVVSHGHKPEGDHSIYSKSSNERLQLILKAEESYKPCSGIDCYLPVIEKDLKPFAQGIYEKEMRLLKDKGTLYQIIDHTVHKIGSCMFPARCAGIEHFLHKVKNNVTDLEFVINTRDYPQVHRHQSKPLPMFSFSKTGDYSDIMYPAWAFWEGGPAIKLYPTGIGRWDKHRKALSQEAAKYPWSKKLNKGFFRGSRTSSERDPLIKLSRENSKLIDAAYTKNQAWKSDADTLHAPPAEEVSFEEHCKYKYLFNFRGVAASFRFKHLFLCKSLVFHVGDEWIEFFYPAMKPWVHYVPVNKHASKQEIRDMLHFFMHHDDVAEKIATRGYEFVMKNLKMKHVTQYWEVLLSKYAALLKYKPRLQK